MTPGQKLTVCHLARWPICRLHSEKLSLASENPGPTRSAHQLFAASRTGSLGPCQRNGFRRPTARPGAVVRPASSFDFCLPNEAARDRDEVGKPYVERVAVAETDNVIAWRIEQEAGGGKATGEPLSGSV